MIDIHCHMLPRMDDGANGLDISLEMARQYIDDGVTHVICTPHIMPGVWNNTGPAIQEAVAALQDRLDEAGLDLTLFPGADNHIVSDFVDGLRSGRLLTLANSRYVLVEPPHHVPHPRLSSVFAEVTQAGYVPILTHPERLTWIEQRYDLLSDLVNQGALMQVTAGSLVGRFGLEAQALALRMLRDGLVHIIATDSHHPELRPALLSEGWRVACDIVGTEEAERLVLRRPFSVLADQHIEVLAQGPLDVLATSQSTGLGISAPPLLHLGQPSGEAQTSSVARLLRKFGRAPI
jgi:protein-tyrosine phosphatase